MMDDTQLLEAYDREVRRECEWTRMRREVVPNIVRHVLTGAGSGGGMVSWSDLTAENADAEIENQIAYFRTVNTGFEWKTYSHDQPADLTARLLAHGFKTEGELEAIMVAEMSALPESYWTMDVSAVQPVTTPEEVDAIVRMESEVWQEEMSGFSTGMKHDLVHYPDHLSVFAVWDGERVVSAAWTHYLIPTSFASFWGGSTLKDYRKRGYYTALLAVRAREARERGYRYLQVDASPESRPILEKHGFRFLGYSTPYEIEFEAQATE
jgi:GNAT superfamily N-acetyltransferase